jgi:hypothetical protein
MFFFHLTGQKKNMQKFDESAILAYHYPTI